MTILTPMRVGILCEFSGITRDAFIARGHDAVSCDILPTEKPGPHIQGDCLAQDWSGFDLLICHPPCTYLTYAGTAHWNKPGRAEKREEAMKFFLALYNLPVGKVCVENPFGYPCQAFRRPNQTINPFDFGEPIRKRTCLWLRGLPPLMVGEDLFGKAFGGRLPPPEPLYVGSRPKARYAMDTSVRRWHWTEAQSSASHKDRAHERSRSFKSIAAEMAAQWG